MPHLSLPLGLIGHLPITTERLTLRLLDDTHLPALAAMLADPDVMRHFPRPMTLLEAESWLRRNRERYRQHGTGLFAVLQRTAVSEAFVGDCGIQVRTFAGQPHVELGYHFVRPVWGRGLATEAARACLALAFATTPTDEVVALVRPENQRSQRVVRRLGMRRDGAVLHAGLVHDVWRVARQAFAELALQ